MEVMNLNAHWRWGIGGIISIWDKNRFEYIICSFLEQVLDLSWNWLIENIEVVTINVHAPNVVEDQRVFWDELVALKYQGLKLWVAEGDFIVVCYLQEQKKWVYMVQPTHPRQDVEECFERDWEHKDTTSTVGVDYAE
ncbi:hypothetical protein V6N13_113773 [Hibiscus sabdariffa]